MTLRGFKTISCYINSLKIFFNGYFVTFRQFFFSNLVLNYLEKHHTIIYRKKRFKGGPSDAIK